MEHDIPFGNSNRQNGPTFLDFPFFLGIFQWDEPTKCVPFTAEPEIPEFLTKWKALRISWIGQQIRRSVLTVLLSLLDTAMLQHWRRQIERKLKKDYFTSYNAKIIYRRKLLLLLGSRLSNLLFSYLFIYLFVCLFVIYSLPVFIDLPVFRND